MTRVLNVVAGAAAMLGVLGLVPCSAAETPAQAAGAAGARGDKSRTADAGARTPRAGEKAAPPASDAGVPAAGGAEFFVAPDGKADAAGTKDAPWDIDSALSGAQKAVKAGDTVWIKGGTYKHANRKGGNGYTVKLVGAEGKPVRVCARPGERATLDGGLQTWEPARHVWLQDLEVIVSENLTGDRTSKGSGSGNPGDLARPWGGVTIRSSGDCKYIDLDIHHNMQGMSMESSLLGPNDEVYGTLIHDNGWKGSDRAHGHAIYGQNKNGTKTVSNCIMTVPFGNGQQMCQVYGSGRAFLDGFHIIQSIAYVPQALAGTPFLIGGSARSNDCHLVENCFYNLDVKLGYSAKGNTGGRVCDNVIFTPSNLRITYFADIEIKNNVLAGIGIIEPIQCGKVVNEGNQVLGKNLPAEPTVRLFPNKYDAKRANLAVFNWQRAAEVKVPAGTFLKAGDSFRLMNPEDFYGKPVFEGKCSGDAVTVPVKGEFAAFVVIKG
jgi:hypothetical protein